MEDSLDLKNAFKLFFQVLIQYNKHRGKCNNYAAKSAVIAINPQKTNTS